MANNKLFQELNLTHSPKRNGYDLGNRVSFTAKCGELLPVWHRTLMIGDKLRFSTKHFTRTAPASTAAMTQIREYFDWFFVPYRLLWRNAPDVHIANKRNPKTATSPTTNSVIGDQVPQISKANIYSHSGLGPGVLARLSFYKNAHGYNRAAMSVKLLNHLGFPFIPDSTVTQLLENNAVSAYPFNLSAVPETLCLYPLLAYQCIYYNFFRNTQWETNQPYNYNTDYLQQSAVVGVNTTVGNTSWTSYWENPTMFDLQYSNYPKDLFFGIFPDAQFGDTAEADVTTDGTIAVSAVNADGDVISPLTVMGGTITDENGTVGDATNPYDLTVRLGEALESAKMSLNMLELRKAQFLQKYKEIVGSGNNDYRTLVKKIFGVDVPDTLAGVPLYLGGKSSTIKINEVQNTNLADGNDATLGGKGTGGASGDMIEFEAVEPGVLMCIYHSQPIVDYSLTALHFDLVKTEADDYANPVFDQLGFQELPSYFLDLGSPSASTLGYTTRYYDYKTSVDMTLGDFRNTRTEWLAPVSLLFLQQYYVNNDYQINANFFRVNPGILDPIFSLKASPTLIDGSENVNANYTSTDQLLIWATVNCQAVRNLDYNGVPY